MGVSNFISGTTLSTLLSSVDVDSAEIDEMNVCADDFAEDMDPEAPETSEFFYDNYKYFHLLCVC